MSKLLIKNMLNEEKPRERLLKYGKESLSNEELLSIIFRSGTKNKSVKELSTELLNSFENMCDLKDININKLTKIKGIGKVKAISLIAALELGKRAYYESVSEKIKIKSTLDIYKLLKFRLKNEKVENFYVILLDTKNNIIDYKLIFKGTTNLITVHPREIFKYAIDNLASSIIIVHNHPSGDTSPSSEDIKITNAVSNLGELIGIKLLDHIIIGSGYYSFYEKNHE